MVSQARRHLRLRSAARVAAVGFSFSVLVGFLMWWVLSEVDDRVVAGPFDSYEDADGYCGGFDDVYAARGGVRKPIAGGHRAALAAAGAVREGDGS